MKLKTKKYIVTAVAKQQSTSEIDNDYVTKSMGAFGAWQLTFCVICVMSRMIATWNLMSVLFLTPKTNFLCVAFENGTKEELKEAENSTCYKNCKEYVYSDGIFEKSIISEFDLVCGNSWLVSFVQTALMFGLFIGVSSFGWVSDRFGRSRALILSAFTNLIFMVAIPFTDHFGTFIFLRILTGFTSGGIMTITAVYTLEMVGQQYREAAGSFALLLDGPSEAILSVFAYYTHTWNDYMLSYTVVSVGIFLLLLCLPETPRWLLVNGRTEELVKLMTNAAKFNNRPTTGIKERVEKAYQELQLKEKDNRNMTYRDLFRTKKLAVTTICSLTVWFVTGVCFYGISQYMSMLDSNLYDVVAILGLTQIPTCPIAMVITKVLGRRASTILADIIVGLSMVVLIFIPENSWSSSVIGIIGATAASTSFVVILLYM